MAADGGATARREATRFLWLYALANAGGVAAYVPLLTLLLPTKMAAAAGAARVEWLGVATIAGAVSASMAGVLWGWASDVLGTRRAWVAAGLTLTLAAYALIGAADTPGATVVAVVVYQAALNMILAPLAAWAADAVPDARKGMLGGLLAAGQPIGALAAVLVTLPFLGGPHAQLAAAGAIAAALIVPLLLAAPPAGRVDETAPVLIQPAPPRRDLLLLWLARLLVQFAGSVLFIYLLYFFQALPGRPASEAEVARLGGATLLAAVPLGLVLGRMSDRLTTRRPFLIGTALGVAAGLAVMSVARGFWPAAAGYALFGCALTVHLALHSATTMQMLPSPRRRGRDLGLFNLTNTLPSLLSPLLAIKLTPAYGFGGLMAALALLVVFAAILLLGVRAKSERA